MTLLECYVENFGKLSKFSYQFTDGMNVFCRENGWGKSTFAGFIKAMLYGLSPSRSTDPQLNERLRYTPWQGGQFGGTLTFSEGDRIYRIERTFGTKESADTFALYDSTTGKPSADYTSNLGEELFSINATGYDRSTYISERMTADQGGDYTGIQAKLVDMQDLADFVIADKKLDKRRQFYRVQTGRGAIYDIEQKLSARRKELEEAENALQKTNELNRRLRDVDAKQTATESMLKDLRRKMETSVTMREARALDAHKADLTQNLSHAKEQCASCRAYLSGNTPTVTELEEQMQIHRTLSQKTTADTPLHVISPLLPILLIFFGILCIPAGLLLGKLLSVTLLSFIGPILGAILIGGGCVCTVLRTRISETLRSHRAALAEYDRLRRALSSFLSAYPIVMADTSLNDDGERLWTIRTKAEDLRNAILTEAEAEAALTAFRNAHPELFDGTAEKTSEENRADSEAEQQLLARLDALHEERDSTRQEIARYAVAAGRYTACAQEISNLDATRVTYEKSFDIVQKTREFLSSARNALTMRYLGDIQFHFRSYLRLLTETDESTMFSDEYTSETFTVTPDFCVNITKYGKTHSADTLSRGGRDLVALCLRFAITDALFRDSRPPLILDDPFINLDDEKTQASMRLLSRIGKERQILYISCHTSRT